MGPTWVLLSAPDGPHVGPMNLAVRVVLIFMSRHLAEPIRLSLTNSVWLSYHPRLKPLSRLVCVVSPYY